MSQQDIIDLEKYATIGIFEEIQGFIQQNGARFTLGEMQREFKSRNERKDWKGIQGLVDSINLRKTIFTPQAGDSKKKQHRELLFDDDYLFWHFRIESLNKFCDHLGRDEKAKLWENIYNPKKPRLTYAILHGVQLIEQGKIESIQIFKQALLLQSFNQVVHFFLKKAYIKFEKDPSHTEDIKSDSLRMDVLKDRSGKICLNPFVNFEIHRHSSHSCCPAWLPTSFGDISKLEIKDAWNSHRAQMIRNSIHNTSFQYCVKPDCAFMKENKLQKVEEIEDPALRKYMESKDLTLNALPLVITLAYDLSCNLACPSCRPKHLIVKKEEHDDLESITSKVISALPDITWLTVSGNGDPFFSPYYKKVLSAISDTKHPNLRLNLYTNALLFTEKNWNKFPNIHNKIENVHISIDAATESTYKEVRRGGDWSLLMKNLQFIATLHRRGYIKNVLYKYVVQNINFREMADFVRLAEDKHAYTWFIRMATPSHFTGSQYAESAIFYEDHPAHGEFMRQLKDPIFTLPNVIMGNLIDMYEKSKNY